LAGVNAQHLDLRGADLSGADLSGADLARIRATSLTGCPALLPAPWVCTTNVLAGPTADFSESTLTNADLNGLDLSQIYAYRGTLNGVNFSGANLSQAYFYESTMLGANWAGADLSQASFYDTTCPDGSRSSYEYPQTCCGHHVGSPPAACN
jgi:uncharacterized protein YjbI with pentapeptide repeats